ncbi:MAG TPA: SEC-C metal-binding domain-containing protein [Phycisphaerae bacterium]|nr:SEC-C metal-binding domain-containing protein [Phycisphaerae bacterium]
MDLQTNERSPAQIEADRLQELARAQRELRLVGLMRQYVSGKKRNRLRRPFGAGRRRTVRGGRDCARNDPCPCGSGRKYKLCCLAAGKRFIHRATIVE